MDGPSKWFGEGWWCLCWVSGRGVRLDLLLVSCIGDIFRRASRISMFCCTGGRWDGLHSLLGTRVYVSEKETCGRLDAFVTTPPLDTHSTFVLYTMPTIQSQTINRTSRARADGYGGPMHGSMGPTEPGATHVLLFNIIKPLYPITPGAYVVYLCLPCAWDDLDCRVW